MEAIWGLKTLTAFHRDTCHQVGGLTDDMQECEERVKRRWTFLD